MAYTSEVLLSFMSGLKPRPTLEALFSAVCEAVSPGVVFGTAKPVPFRQGLVRPRFEEFFRSPFIR
jgi:hypothetical protein